jgi:poly(beta-D-mannuronate) lyase
MNTNVFFKHKPLIALIGVTGLLSVYSGNLKSEGQNLSLIPGSVFDLSPWKITMPYDLDGNGKSDEIDVKELKTFSNPDFFYINENKELVFTTPNKGASTSSLASTRTELRQMNRGLNTEISTHAPANNVALAANKNADQFGAIGGKLNATLKVNAVSLEAGYPDKKPAYTVVVAEFHSGKIADHPEGFGWSNQPIKIYYKKFPNHDKGSIFWNYERNLPREDPNRVDLSYPVWGNTWGNAADPGKAGISLGEEFSYEINIHENTMHLTFQSEGHPEVKYSVNLSNNIDPNGNVDVLDNPKGYSGDWFFFKAGSYNECNTKDGTHFVQTACPGTGDWDTDKKNGHYSSVAFSKLVLSDSTPVK